MTVKPYRGMQSFTKEERAVICKRFRDGEDLRNEPKRLAQKIIDMAIAEHTYVLDILLFLEDDGYLKVGTSYDTQFFLLKDIWKTEDDPTKSNERKLEKWLYPIS